MNESCISAKKRISDHHSGKCKKVCCTELIASVFVRLGFDYVWFSSVVKYIYLCVFSGLLSVILLFHRPIVILIWVGNEGCWTHVRIVCSRMCLITAVHNSVESGLQSFAFSAFALTLVYYTFLTTALLLLSLLFTI